MDVETEAGASAETQLEALYGRLHEYRLLEAKTQPRLHLAANGENGEVTSGSRDGAALVMRCLKMWFDLPAELFLHAVNLLDRFLTKMKVRPSHLPCISVSCMNIGIQERGLAVPLDELISISQCGCTQRDVERMTAVVREKLSLAGGGAPVTALEWLRLLTALSEWAAGRHRLTLLYTERELIGQLETVMCDATCVNMPASLVALVLLVDQLESNTSSAVASGAMRPEEGRRALEVCAELARVCGAEAESARAGTVRAAVRAALQRGAARSRHRQRLVWRLSERTLKVLRPTERLMSRLPTIVEQNQACEPTPRPRSSSESSESGESADWPQSSVLPVCCE